MKLNLKFLAFILCIFFVQPSIAETENSNQLALPNSDLEAPKVKHVPPSGLLADGNLRFTADVVDNVAVKSVVLFYREPNTQTFHSMNMARTALDSSIFAATIDKSSFMANGIEYYIQADDTSGNSLLHGYSFSPIVLSINGTQTSIVSDPSKTTTFDKFPVSEKPIWKNKWFWIGIGVTAVAVASQNSGGDSSASSKPNTGSIIVDGPAP